MSLATTPRRTHEYERRRYVLAVVGQDVLLIAIVAAALVGRLTPGGASPFLLALAGGAFVVLAWGFGTLNFPSRVTVTGDGVTFARYGRAHAYAWRDVQAVRVRRFLVRDRVLVRLSPAPPLRGRYWLLEGLNGFGDLVAELERQGRARRA